ncbi:MAG: hypothetical protein Q4G01_09440 [Eubacteriales bacterium]|nr:hypothetical protein [Eubacteriales bacterium]
MSDLSYSTIFPLGQENTEYAQYFVGKSYLNMLSTQGVVIGNVTFEPGCRNNWHIHKASKRGGQMAVEVPGEDASNEWMEPVTDEEYHKLP